MHSSNLTRITSLLASMWLLGPAIFGDQTSLEPQEGQAASYQRTAAHSARSQRYTDLPPVLLPETVVAAANDSVKGEVVFAFVVDTAGHIELSTVETLSAADSATARGARGVLPRVRYIPARIVQDAGNCVRINGALMHCGGSVPVVRKLRSRVVLRIEHFKAGQ